MQDNYTSLELAKKLEGGGFNEVSARCWYKDNLVSVLCYDNFMQTVHFEDFDDENVDAPFVDINEVTWSYDILNDICTKYAKEFFGEDGELITGIVNEILRLSRRGEKQEAEEYIWSNTIFNPKNQ